MCGSKGGGRVFQGVRMDTEGACRGKEKQKERCIYRFREEAKTMQRIFREMGLTRARNPTKVARCVLDGNTLLSHR